MLATHSGKPESTLPVSWQAWLSTLLAEREAAHLLRRTRINESAQGPQVHVEGRLLRNFCSNDYLGLANAPELQDAVAQAVRRVGVGAGSASLVCGHHREHEALEEELADWLNVESVLLFGNGYLANVGCLNGLLGSGDAIFQDRLNHASLIDGGLSSGARQQRYAHASAEDLAQRLATVKARRTLVVTDGVFSMDGDIAPLPTLLAPIEVHGALLMLDEAHAFGVIGAGGRGTVSHFKLAANRVPLRVGTLGKAFGVYGAFAAGPKVLINALQQVARTAIYTTAYPPALAAATRVALKMLCDDDWRRLRLQTHIHRLRKGLLAQGWHLMASNTPIQPIVIGSAERALALSQALNARGFWVSAIRPPTVPAGSARLRLTLTAAHEDSDIDALLNVMAELAPMFADTLAEESA